MTNMPLFNRNSLQSLITLTCCLFMMQVSPVFSQETITWKNNVKGWRIAVDSSIGDSCFMVTAYEGGTLLRAQVNMNEEIFQFILADSSWKSLETGKLYDIKVQFGTLAPWTGLASVHHFSDDLPALIFDVTFEDEKAELFIEEFMRMTGVLIFYSGNVISNLSLSGTYAAMQEVFACQSAMLDGGSGRDSDPFSNTPENSNDPFQ